MIRWLEENGYHGYWRRTPRGLHAGTSNYTPDFELSVQLHGQTHRALVEIKPSLDFLQGNVLERMAGAAKHYFTDALFIYTEKDNAWHQVDPKTLAIRPTVLPPRGSIPIAQLKEPWKIKARSVGTHSYTKRSSGKSGCCLSWADFFSCWLCSPAA